MSDWGMYVELDETHIEGMVSLREMEDDLYQFERTATRSMDAAKDGSSPWAMPCASASSGPICNAVSSISNWCTMRRPTPARTT